MPAHSTTVKVARAVYIGSSCRCPSPLPESPRAGTVQVRASPHGTLWSPLPSPKSIPLHAFDLWHGSGSRFSQSPSQDHISRVSPGIGTTIGVIAGGRDRTPPPATAWDEPALPHGLSVETTVHPAGSGSPPDPSPPPRWGCFSFGISAAPRSGRSPSALPDPLPW